MKYPNLTSATIIKDSISSRGHRMTTIKMVFPRYILAELNTHRMFGRNSASSRAIPLRKMIRSAIDNPFIPMAFQKDHTGMQGSEYFDPNKNVKFPKFIDILKNIFKLSDESIEEATRSGKDADIAGYLWEMMDDVEAVEFNLVQWWLYCRDQAVKSAMLMAALGVTKQLCNRILEPFIYHTALITSTEWENFFELRCPKYEHQHNTFYKSKKDVLKNIKESPIYNNETDINYANSLNTIDWLERNSGMGEIHIMDLAEKVYDAMDESTPDVLKDGEWHIPFMDKNTIDKLIEFTPKHGTIHPEEDSSVLERQFYNDILNNSIKIATARAARISYESLGDNPVIDYEKDIKLHDDLLRDKHMSPFEHIGRAMTAEEYDTHIRGIIIGYNPMGYAGIQEEVKGWSRNLRGFIQYREIVEQNG